MLKRITHFFKKILGFSAPPSILAYRGFGTPRKVFISGHILYDRRLYEANEQSRRFRNFRAMLSRFTSRAAPGITVEVHFSGATQTICTDEMGRYEAVFEFADTPLQAGWIPATVRVKDGFEPEKMPDEVETDVLIVSDNAKTGVISDVDDTILISDATKTLSKLRLILTKNAHTRLPFPGIANFYKALLDGEKGMEEHPLFFVSSSEWNLYDFLVDFCQLKGIPKGVFFLKEIKLGLWKLIKSGGGNHNHKYDKIVRILDTYPHINFILVGDSGQHDPEIYERIAQEYPGRLRAVYIRDVSKPARDQEVENISGRVKEKVELLLIPDTLAASEHAHKNGWITEEGHKMTVEAFRENERVPA